jgi:hypothetical protein
MTIVGIVGVTFLAGSPRRLLRPRTFTSES